MEKRLRGQSRGGDFSDSHGKHGRLSRLSRSFWRAVRRGE